MAAAPMTQEQTWSDRPSTTRLSGIQTGRNRKRPQQMPSLRSSGGWACSLLQNLCLPEGEPYGRVCRRWASFAANFASAHVRQAFGVFRGHIKEFAQGRLGSNGNGSVPILLALAGSDTEDHEATMIQAEHLLREELPEACTAIVGPSDLRNLAFANRKICEQLLRGQNTAFSVEAGADEDAEEDEEVHGVMSTMDFVDWRREQGGGPIVLLVQSTEAVATDVLKDVLCFWSEACRSHQPDSTIPFMVFLGLKQLPSSRSAFFEEEPLPLLHVDTVQLFDSEKVCSQLWDQLAEDGACPFALSPDALQRLRNTFVYDQQSFSHVLRMLVKLTESALTQNAMASFCLPVHPKGDIPCMERVEVCSAVAKHLKNGLASQQRELTQELAQLWPDIDASGSLGQAAVDAATEAIMWRWKVIDSIKVWEVLLMAADKLTRHVVRLRRLWKLLDHLWPVPEDGQAKQDAGLNALFRTVWMKLNCLPREELVELLQELDAASGRLGVTLQNGIRTLTQKARMPEGSSGFQTDDRIRTDFQMWFNDVRVNHWQPLRGHARDLFAAVLSSSKDAFETAERRLSGKDQFTQLAYIRDTSAHSALTDTSLVYRLLECHAGKHIKVADLWLTFLRVLEPENADAVVQASQPRQKKTKDEHIEEIKRRFKMSLLNLHKLGCFAPASGNACKGLSGWRLRKRPFGRVWLKDAQRAISIPDVVSWQTSSTPAAEPASITPVAETVDDPATPERPRRTLQRFASDEKTPLQIGLGSHLKRLPFPRQYAGAVQPEPDVEPPDKKRRRDKIFFG